MFVVPLMRSGLSRSADPFPAILDFWTNFKDTHVGFPNNHILAGPNGHSDLAAGRCFSPCKLQ